MDRGTFNEFVSACYNIYIRDIHGQGTQGGHIREREYTREGIYESEDIHGEGTYT